MSRTTQVLILTLPALAATLWLGAAGCSGSNEPSTNSGTGGTGGATSTGAGTGSGATGGTTGGTSSTGGSGGSSGTGGGGMTDSGGGTDFSPLCSALVTQAGEEPAKGVACTASDTQLCYRTCGPSSIGFKFERCTAGAYVEQSGCTFPPGKDYACYKIPAAISSTCPATAPQASQACTVAECTLCNAGGMYLDSGGASKEGYCVCPPASGSGTRKWTCASSTAWPCPMGEGC